MKQLHLYNTLSRKKEVFEPLSADKVTMYVCGPTVYSYAHIGNARPAVVFDVLYRVLKEQYDNVIYARNITDIEDKIIDAALAEGKPISEITNKYKKIYHEDLKALYVLPPVIEPHATEHITEMLEMIQALIDKGFAYAADGHVLFDVAKYKDYGRLSNRKLDELIAGLRVEVASYKRNPGDFVLWKPSVGEQPGWPSPWINDDKSNEADGRGLGRPGWHIECSSMAEKHLGKTIDIHGGGHDLIFPHHENEIAQSTCAHDGAPFARYWLHNGFVNIDAEKMSKSLGNVTLVRDLLKHHDGETLRLALLSTHYRKPLDWTAVTTEQAKNKLNRLYRAIKTGQEHSDSSGLEIAAIRPSEALMTALNDDLNTPQAIDVLLKQAAKIQKKAENSNSAELLAQLLKDASVLGLLSRQPEQWFTDESMDDAFKEKIEAQIRLRNQARKDKDFALADKIRDELTAEGIEIEDGPEGTSWRKID